MINNIATEIIELAEASAASPEMSYAPVAISTDKRKVDISKTTLKYWQLGGPLATDKIGHAHGPIFMIEFVDIPAASFIKVWGLDNQNDNAVVYPTDYLIQFPKLQVWLQKFEWTDSNGDTVTAPGSYTILGHRNRKLPMMGF